MLDTQESAEIVNKVISACTFPGATELEDPRCHICRDDSLGTGGAEKATRLPCGHVLGMSCLMRWAFKQIDDGCTVVDCPFCRRSFLNIPTTITQRNNRRAEELEHWIHHLSQWAPGDPRDLTNERILKFRRAEELWDGFCRVILDSVQRSISPSDFGLGADIEEFLCRASPVAQRILSFGNVYNFHLAYMIQGYRPDEDTDAVLPGFWEPYHELVAHLRTMVTPDEEWRIYQAFQCPNGQFEKYRLKLEHCRYLLGMRIEEARAAARG